MSATATTPRTVTRQPTATPEYCPQDKEEPPTGSLRVFFVQDGNIRVWEEATGTSETLVGSGDVYRLYLPPDGQVIAFLRQEETGGEAYQRQMGLWAVDSDGGNQRLLISGDEFRALGPARVGDSDVLAVNPTELQWVPGTRRLAFRAMPIINALGAGPEPEIRLVDVATGERTVLLTTKAESSFSFSPDGKRLTLADDTSIDVVVLAQPGEINGSDRLEDVVTYPHIGLGHVAYQAVPNWAPDGHSFSVVLPSADPYAEDATLTVWQVSADTGASEQLATFSGFPLPIFGSFGSAVFSPDRSQIAFYRTQQGNLGELAIANVRGEWHAVYDSGHSIRFLGWSPDGVHFVYTYGAARRPLRLGRLCQPPQVFEGPPVTPDTPVTWVDDERFLYLSGDHDPATLLLGALDGSVHEIGRLSGLYETYAFAR